MHTDFVDEDALQNSTVMSAYSVVFITQPNVPKAALESAAAWVKKGGVLVLSGGAAVADQYATPDTTLPDASGCEMSAFPRVVLHEARQIPGPSPLPHLANGRITTASASTKVPFSALGSVNVFTKLGANSKVTATFDSASKCVTALSKQCGAAKTVSVVACDTCTEKKQTALHTAGCGVTREKTWCRSPPPGVSVDSAAAVETVVGAGKIVQFAWLPGMSYLANATQEFFVPNARTQFPEVIREILGDLVSDAGYTPSVIVTTPDDTANVVGVETVLLTAYNGAVVTVVNWVDDGTVPKYMLKLNVTEAGFASADEIGQVLDAHSGNVLTPKVSGTDIVIVPITLHHATFVVFSKK